MREKNLEYSPHRAAISASQGSSKLERLAAAFVAVRPGLRSASAVGGGNVSPAKHVRKKSYISNGKYTCAHVHWARGRGGRRH